MSIEPGAPTFAVVLTPPGRAAIASVLVAGPRAEAIMATLFRPAGTRALDDAPPGRIVFGRWRSDDGEELVVARRAADTIEIHCHGGWAAPQQILTDLVEVGCQALNWCDWIARPGVDRLTAEATIALAHARTERAALVLLDQYGGALARALTTIGDHLAAHSWVEAGKQVDDLLARAAVGLHLTEPWRVALAGRPNAGKSSLINALLGYARAIVFDAPGTTRDVVTADAALDGWPVELADTAGLRASDDLLEAAGVARTREQLATADAVVLVFDAALDWSAADADLLAAWPESIVVHNKCDLVRARGDRRPPGLWTSALAGHGLDELVSAIVTRLVPCAPPAHSGVPFTVRQIEALHELRSALAAADAPRARRCHADLLGLPA